MEHEETTNGKIESAYFVDAACSSFRRFEKFNGNIKFCLLSVDVSLSKIEPPLLRGKSKLREISIRYICAGNSLSSLTILKTLHWCFPRESNGNKSIILCTKYVSRCSTKSSNVGHKIIIFFRKIASCIVLLRS